MLETQFGLRRVGNGWVSERVQDCKEVDDPEVVFLVLQKLRQQIQFDKVVVLPAPEGTLVACNSQPPKAMVTALNIDGAVKLAGNINAGGKIIMLGNAILVPWP
jgi:hypothetical protein